MPMEFKLPDLGENIESGDVVSLLVKVGDRIEPQQPLLELETDKAVVEVPASVGGTIKEIHVKSGERASVGQLLLTIDSEGSTPTPDSSSAHAVSAPAQPQADPVEPDPSAAGPAEVVAFAVRPEADRERLPRVIPASPAIRRLARETGVDIEQVTGTGPGGRITREDLQQANSADPGVSPPLSAAPEGLPDFSRWGEVEARAFSNVRRVTARRMTRSWLSIPHVTQHDECDITELEKRRQQYSARVEKAGARLTVTAIAVRLLASALKMFPEFNASIDTQGQRVILKKYIHIGVAVDTSRGLLVPVIRNVDQKNIVQIAVELAELAELAREGRLSLDQMQGGTFTVTNLGGIGGTSFAPIVNWPEVAILGIARAGERPVYRDGALVPRIILPVSLSYDHRLIDGANAARFLRWVAASLEDLFLSVLEG